MEEKKPRIAAIVVTYNRCDLLVNCLKAIEGQTLKPDVVFIIDNASTDDTENHVKSFSHSIPYEYIKLPENIGGAGGFYTGLKTAHERNEYKAFWVMDDDGVPKEDCLEKLFTNLNQGYVAPLVMDIDNHENVAFPYLGEKKINQIHQKYGKEGFIQGYANPFNGILLSDKFLIEVGYPKKEMFIWGDEVEYNARAISRGFIPQTIVSAVHFHPKDRLVKFNNFLGRKYIIYVQSPLRRYCKYRNTAYTMIRYTSKYKLVKRIYYKLSYIFYFIVNRHWDIKGLELFLKADKDGLNSDFSHTKEYQF